MPKFNFEEEIYSEPRDPFLTFGKVFIGLIIAGFVILCLNVLLLQKEAEMKAIEKAIEKTRKQAEWKKYTETIIGAPTYKTTKN